MMFGINEGRRSGARNSDELQPTIIIEFLFSPFYAHAFAAQLLPLAAYIFPPISYFVGIFGGNGIIF